MTERLATAGEDTIVAISTPPGEGGVGIVRLSGERALEIAAALFRSTRNKDILHSSDRVFYGHIVNELGHVLDEVLLHCMRSPHSFTREDVVEINGHGGPAPLNAVLEACLKQGARLAQPGEFTYRAFLNGRIDLVQAEAVIDTIRARTLGSLQAANATASGVLSKSLHTLTERLAHALAYIEAAVDFPEEDLPDLVTPELIDNVRGVHQDMLHLLNTADAGRLYREGANVAIVGRPNVGKSSLFNLLLRDARAIVTEHAGTTRDRLEEYITLAGIPVKLVDTAGLRTTDDAVERIGVDLAREALQSAHVVLFVLDSAEALAEEDYALAEELSSLEVPVVLIQNKCDVAPDAAPPELPLDYAATCQLSALKGTGLQDLEDALTDLLLGGVNLSAGEVMLTRMHQKDSLRRAAECVQRLLDSLELSPEFLAFELREALQAIGEITGETTPEDLLDTIFSSFCIGK